MIIRKAVKEDIPFIVNAVIQIENFSDKNTFNNLFGCDIETTKTYLEQFFLDEENLDNEFSLNTYVVAEIEGKLAGCCCLIFMDNNYYEQKSALFPIHLKKEHLEYFMDVASQLPNTKEYSHNRHFLEYLFVSDDFRGYGVSKEIINYLFSKTEVLYLMPLITNTFAVDYYRRLGFKEVNGVESFLIEEPGQKIYPCSSKLLLYKENEMMIKQ